jgi:hypothetical protein
VVWGTHHSKKGSEKTTVSTISAVSPQKYYGKLEQRHRTLRQRSNTLLCWHRLSRLVQRVSPKTKGSHLIYPCKQVTEAKKQNKNKKQGLTHEWLFANLFGKKPKKKKKKRKQGLTFNPYMVICKFVGYFTLVLSALLPLECYVTYFTFGFFRFYLSAIPSLPPCYFIRVQACLFLF